MTYPILQNSARAPYASGSHPESPLAIEELSSAADFATYEREWRDLVERVPAASLYHTWEWLGARITAFWQDETLAIMLARRGGRLVAGAPFVVDRKAEQWCKGSLTVPEQGVDLLSSEPVPELLNAVFGHLPRTRRRWRIGLHRFPVESEVVASIPEIARRHGLRAFVRAADPSRLVRVDGDWDAYLASRSKKVRREWQRKRQKLEGSGQVEFRTAKGPAEIESFLDDVLAIEQRSWKQSQGSSIASRHDSSDFFKQFAFNCASRGWLRLHVLHVDSKPIAHFYGVVFRNQLYGLKTSFDSAYASLSPGIMVVLHALRSAFEERVSMVDFLGYDSRWKAEVANGMREQAHVCVFTSNAVGCRTCALLRGRVKPILEERMPGLLEAGKKAASWVHNLRQRN